MRRIRRIRHPLRTSHPYYWIVALVGERTVLIGPYDSRQEANDVGYGKVGGYFDVVELMTRDRSRASQMVKEMKLEKTGDIDKALERVKHEEL